MYITEKDKEAKGEKDYLSNPKGFFRMMRDNLNIQIIEANSQQARAELREEITNSLG
jgi:hypothetical protein